MDGWRSCPKSQVVFRVVRSTGRVTLRPPYGLEVPKPKSQEMSGMCCLVALSKGDADAIQCNLEYSVHGSLLERMDLIGWVVSVCAVAAWA